MNWYLVVGEKAESLKPQAYADEAEAIAMCNANNYALRTLGPWEVVPVAEVKQPNPITTDEE